MQLIRRVLPDICPITSLIDIFRVFRHWIVQLGIRIAPWPLGAATCWRHRRHAFLFHRRSPLAEWDNAHLPIRFSVCDCFKSRRRLEAEILVRRHQLKVLQQRAPRRLSLIWADRALFVSLYCPYRKPVGGEFIITLRLASARPVPVGRGTAPPRLDCRGRSVYARICEFAMDTPSHADPYPGVFLRWNFLSRHRLSHQYFFSRS